MHCTEQIRCALRPVLMRQGLWKSLWNSYEAALMNVSGTVLCSLMERLWRPFICPDQALMRHRTFIRLRGCYAPRVPHKTSIIHWFEESLMEALRRALPIR